MFRSMETVILVGFAPSVLVTPKVMEVVTVERGTVETGVTGLRREKSMNQKHKKALAWR